MSRNNIPIKFFLGANTPRGFYSLFNQLKCSENGWDTIVLKGGPGTGKSSGMMRIADEISDPHTEYIYCSSDVKSIDAIIMHDKKVSVADGTAPHSLEPKYPGVEEHIVPLGSCWDVDMLKQHTSFIKSSGTKKSERHNLSCKFLEAASSFLYDNMRIASNNTDFKKISNYASRFAIKYLRTISHNKGIESSRFLSAFTSEGSTFFSQTPLAYCDNIIVLNDIYGAVSNYLLSAIRSKALERGYDVISCLSPLHPENIEHLIIPDANVSIITHSIVNKVDFEGSKNIHFSRFTNMDDMKKDKKNLSLNIKIANQMLTQASQCLADAKDTHLAIEKIYTPAVDFAKIDLLFNDTIDFINNK